MSRADAAHSERERLASDVGLTTLIDAHERVDWREVPQVSPAEAAAWTQRLIEARADQEGCPDG